MPEEKSYYYETKCRRCGKLEEWYFGDVETISFERFLVSMDSHLREPRIMNCEKCLKDTIQDLVSHTNEDLSKKEEICG